MILEVPSPVSVIIDGKAVSAALRSRLAAAAAALKAKHDLVPGLAVVLVGDDPASDVYVRSKARATIEAGFHSAEYRLPATIGQAALLDLVRRLNADPEIHGILVQLPLPPGYAADAVIAAIDPAKDVDGLHPYNAGALWNGLPGFVPCTPLGCLILIRQVRNALAGLAAVVIGRSVLVGKPIAGLLLAEHCTVTIAHSRSADLPGLCRRADILVAAIGRPALVRGSWIKPGATVIDVGINRITDADGKQRLIGDVAFAEAAEIAGAITPVPGGVGPMTIACLLRNTLTACCRSNALPEPLG
jgi:methylenetetrahydrofolate dehydrogenase (NADP+) / methenyltetrahydrofolate cyclohydrolase